MHILRLISEDELSIKPPPLKIPGVFITERLELEATNCYNDKKSLREMPITYAKKNQ